MAYVAVKIECNPVTCGKCKYQDSTFCKLFDLPPQTRGGKSKRLLSCEVFEIQNESCILNSIT